MKPGSPADEHDNSRYVYCVALASQVAPLEETGIQGRNVYAVPHRAIAAIVHNCPPAPAQQPAGSEAKAWVLAHHRVVDAAWKRWGAVLPMNFNTVIVGGEKSAKEQLHLWLESEYESMTAKLGGFVGKAEYGVQVFWDVKAVGKDLVAKSADLKAWKEEIDRKSRGLAYMEGQRLEKAARERIQAEARVRYEQFHERISQHAGSVAVDKTGRSDHPGQMLMNLSCLVTEEQYPALTAELTRIDAGEGYSVRVTGPWPPYSFC